jgi:U2-associated protein SR140
MDGSSQLPYGLDHTSIKPGAVRSMTSDKLASFSLGNSKKTPFQKHKEAKEAKRKVRATAKEPGH